MNLRSEIPLTVVGGRSIQWVGLIALCAAISVQAARIDSDFNPRFGDGFTYSGEDHFSDVTPDGRLFLNNGYVGWNPDGSVDPNFDPPNDGRHSVKSLYTGQLVGFYRPEKTMHPCKEDPSENCGPFVENRRIVWLDSEGQKTEVGFEFDSDLLSMPSGSIKNYLNGKYLLFGDFHSVNGVARSRIAKVNGDGSLDLSFDAGTVHDFVEGIWVQSDGRILIWGNFSEFSGHDLPGLVRLNGDGTVDAAFTPDSPAGVYVIDGHTYLRIGPVAEDSEGRILRAFRGAIYRSDAAGMNSELLIEVGHPDRMEVDDFLPLENGAFLVWGDFGAIGGVRRSYLALINGDGSVDLGFHASAVRSNPHRVRRTDDGRLVPFGGGLLRLMADGSIDPSLMPESPRPASIDAVTVDSEGKIMVAGPFTHMGSIPRAGLARLFPDGSLDPSFDPRNTADVGRYPSILTDRDGGVWVGGGALTRHSSDGLIDPSVSVEIGAEKYGGILTLVEDSQRRVTFGGHFDTVNGLTRAGLARLKADRTIDPLFANGIALTGSDVEVSHLEVLNDGGLLVAGAFDAWKGVRRWGLLKLHADGELNTDFVPNVALAGLTVVAAAAHEDGSVSVAALDPDFDRGPVGTIHLLDSAGRQVAFIEPSLAKDTVVLDALALPGGSTVFSVVPNVHWSQKYARLESNPGHPPFLVTLNESGEWDNRFVPEIDSNLVHSMALMPDGSIVIAGDFVGFDGVSVSNLVRVQDLDSPLVSRLANISTRGQVAEGARQLIAGFVVGGTEPQRVLIRGVGPTLLDYGIENALADPFFKVSDGQPGAIVRVSNPEDWYRFWGKGVIERIPRVLDMFIRVGAFPLTGSNPGFWTKSPMDAVMILDLEPGAYTVQLSGVNAAIGLIEVFNANGVEGDRRITNLSTRGWVGVGHDRLLGGFVIDRGQTRVLVRAVGPQLESFGVTDFLADPQVRVVRTENIDEVASNDNWEEDGTAESITAATIAVGAFPLDSGNLDAALVLDLEPGEYTAIVSGVGQTTGIALVEVYELPDS